MKNLYLLFRLSSVIRPYSDDSYTPSRFPFGFNEMPLPIHASKNLDKEELQSSVFYST